MNTTSTQTTASQARMPVDMCDTHNTPQHVAAEYGITTPVTLQRSRTQRTARCVVCHADAANHYLAKWATS